MSSTLEGNLENETERFFSSLGLDLPESWEVKVRPDGSKRLDGEAKEGKVWLYPETDRNGEIEAPNDANQWNGKAVHETAHSVFNDKVENREDPDALNGFVEEYGSELKQAEENVKKEFFEGRELDSLQELHWSIFIGNRPYHEMEEVLAHVIDLRLEFMSDKLSEETLDQYQKSIGRAGVNEVQAKAVEGNYEEGSFSASVDQLFDPMQLASYSLRATDVLNVKTEDMTRYMEDEGYDSFLRLSADEILNKFYEKPLP